MSRLPFSEPTLQGARRIAETAPPAECDPRVEALVSVSSKSRTSPICASWISETRTPSDPNFNPASVHLVCGYSPIAARGWPVRDIRVSQTCSSSSWIP